VPLGRPIANTRLSVLDAALRPVPVGVPGELYVAGAGVGRGYLGDPARTAAVFRPDPSEPGARMYATGDRVRYLPDGRLEYLGRRDHQVKIRGHRIELGEVEAAVRAVDGVTDAVVLVPPGPSRLVAYAVGPVEPAAVRQRLAATLPGPMVPSAIVVLDALPLTANCKVDRAALPAAPAVAQQAGYVAPRPGAEERLAALFAEVFEVERIGARDDFFDLGGHSLLATRLVARMREEFGVAVALRTVFDRPVLADLAATLDTAG